MENACDGLFTRSRVLWKTLSNGRYSVLAGLPTLTLAAALATPGNLHITYSFFEGGNPPAVTINFVQLIRRWKNFRQGWIYIRDFKPVIPAKSGVRKLISWVPSVLIYSISKVVSSIRRFHAGTAFLQQTTRKPIENLIIWLKYEKSFEVH